MNYLDLVRIDPTVSVQKALIPQQIYLHGIDGEPIRIHRHDYIGASEIKMPSGEMQTLVLLRGKNVDGIQPSISVLDSPQDVENIANGFITEAYRKFWTQDLLKISDLERKKIIEVLARDHSNQLHQLGVDQAAEIRAIQGEISIAESHIRYEDTQYKQKGLGAKLLHNVGTGRIKQKQAIDEAQARIRVLEKSQRDTEVRHQEQTRDITSRHNSQNHEADNLLQTLKDPNWIDSEVDMLQAYFSAFVSQTYDRQNGYDITDVDLPDSTPADMRAAYALLFKMDASKPHKPKPDPFGNSANSSMGLSFSFGRSVRLNEFDEEEIRRRRQRNRSHGLGMSRGWDHER